MEDLQLTEDAEKIDSAVNEVAALTNLFQIFGGILIIIMSLFILLGSAFAFYWTKVILIEISIGIVMVALFLMAIFWVLPIKSKDMFDSLLQASGLILLIYPIMTVGQTTPFDTPADYLFGIETTYWLFYCLIGLVFLILPNLKEGNQIRNKLGAFLPHLSFILGTMILPFWFLTLTQVTEMNMSVAFYTLLLLSSSLVVVVYSLLNVLFPDEIGPKHLYDL